jgi:hypothetical protein
MTAKTILELHLTLAEGREVECAATLESQMRPEVWRVLLALAAEILATDERHRQGSAVVLVTGSAAAERVLADLKA